MSQNFSVPHHLLNEVVVHFHFGLSVNDWLSLWRTLLLLVTLLRRLSLWNLLVVLGGLIYEPRLVLHLIALHHDGLVHGLMLSVLIVSRV